MVEVEEQARQLAAMYDASPIGLAVLDTELRYVRINEQLAKLNGIPAPAHIGRSVSEMIPDLSDQALAAFNRVLAGEELTNIELVGPTRARPDQTSVWRQNWVPMRDAAGSVIGVAVSCEDVSEQSRAQKAVKALNRINTALAAEHDLERLVQMVTDAGVELTGASVGAFFHNVLDESGERLHLFTLTGADREVFTKLGRPRGTKVLEPLFRNEVIRSEDITKDPRYGFNAPYGGMPPGHPVVTSYLAVPVVARDGKVLGGLLFGHPKPGCFSHHHEELIGSLASQAAVAIENARLLAQVQAANEMLERRVTERTAERDCAWQLSRDLLITVDANGMLHSVSPAWKTVLGHHPSEVIGRSYRDFVHPDDIDRTEVALLAATSGEPVPVFENRYIATDGSTRWISWLTSVDGSLIYGSGRDVTEARAKDDILRATEEALRQSQKMEAMGQLTGGVAHDFNNLLTPILGSLDLIRRKVPDDDRSSRLLDGAIQSAERARLLVQRLLAFARRQPLQAGAVDLATMVREISALLSTTLGPRVQLVIETREDLPPALADRSQLEMALVNLAVNARDAMPGGGLLRINVSDREINEGDPRLSPGSYVHLAVTDTGLGMDADTLTRAIEPFFSTKGLGRGSGLGLSMVHGLASQLGGAFQLTSSPGAGTTAEMWLPISTVTVVATPATTFDVGADIGTSVGRVLLVDDEDAVRAAAAQMLDDLGYEVIEADNADAALRLIADGLVPDLLVSDHLMPGMTGTELARQLRARLPQVGVLIVSGYADVETLSPDLAHLPKPFRQADLEQAIAGPKVLPHQLVQLAIPS